MSEVTRLRVYRDNKGEWRWEGIAGNGEVIDQSSEGYEHRGYAAEQAAGIHPDAELRIEEPDLS